ncbi:uncharacterized protein LOC120476563 isoform X2 [Pimephales promelas]|uniref:uncharacterized protein LOC120476563 isoform X2 n=1 Tax=Pimephales promelas TaxID=90988 RepID=UPI001955507D|nr:uncharacterized protein LOC120476563 isoform X2 [Pimephales promelas]
MQRYTWSSNQRPPPQYQERPPPQYQERPPPQYQERPSIRYQEQFPPKYQDVRDEQSNMFQAQFNTQHYTTSPTRYSNGQQEASNHCQSFQSNLHGYNPQTNQAHPQYPCAASNTQQHYPSENPNTNGYHAQFGTQSNVSSPHNYGETGRNQAYMYRSPQSNHGNSVVNNRSWNFHMYNSHSFYSMNNQQQFQPPRTAPRHHHHQQQQFSRQHSGKKHKSHHRTQGHHPQSSSWAHNNAVSQRISNNQAQSQMVASYTSCNSTTPPSGAQSEIPLPSNNLNQSPVTHNQPELRSNAGPDVSTNHSQNNQSTEQQSQGTNGGTYNNEASQMTWTNEAPPQTHYRFNNSLIYQLLTSKDNKQAGKQLIPDERNAHHNTCSEQSEVCATNRTDHHSHFSEPSVQCAVEPPSKIMENAVQKDYWNKETRVSKDRNDFGVQSVRPGTHQTGSNKNRPKEMSQYNIQYSTDPADCLEAVFALKKVSQQVHKAIAIVPPISQQTSNTAQMADTSPKKADSPPLKIDSVWSFAESDAQKTADDKLSESPSPTAQQEDKSQEIETTSNIADSDICSTSPVECQNNVQQGDCDSSDTSFDLSSVPVVKYTLGNLMDLVKSLEMTELSNEYAEISESILKHCWNGNKANLVEALKSFKQEVELHSSVEIVRDYESVVFESIETENLKKLAHCDNLNDEMYSSSEEYRSSWLNVDGQPADIDKVLSEPLLDDITVIKTTSQLFSENTVVTLSNLGVNSLKDVPMVSSKEKSVKPDTCRPTALFTPQSGNDIEEIATENNGHSYAGLSRITSLSSNSSENETFKKQEDIKHSHNFNTKPSENVPLAEGSTEIRTACSDEIEVFRQDHYEQICHNVPVSEALPLSPEDNVSDGVKNSEESLSTETLCNSKDTWLVEDISEDENPDHKEALNNSSDIGLVDDISEDENPDHKEALNNSSDIGLVEDISEDENPGHKEAFNNSSDIGLVEDISEDENPGHKEAFNNSSDIGLVDDISEDENPDHKEALNNSSDIGLVEDISEDENPDHKEALNNSSDIGLVDAISEDENPGHKLALNNSSDIGLLEDISDDENTGNKEEVLPISSDIWHVEDISDDENPGNEEALNNSSDIGLVEDASEDENPGNIEALNNCSDIWLVEDITDDENTGNREVLPISSDNWHMEDISDGEDPSNKDTSSNSPDICVVEDVSNDENSKDDDPLLLGITVLSSEDAKTFFQKMEDKPLCSIKTTTSKLDNPDLVACFDVPSQPSPAICSLCGTKMAISNSTNVTYSDADIFCFQCWEQAPLLVLEEQPCSPMTNEADVLGSPAKSNKQGQDCSPLCVKLEVMELNVASTNECIVDERLTTRRSSHMIKSEPGQDSPSLELKDKELKVTSPEKCFENEGQKRDTMDKSELRQTCSPPFLDLKVKELTVTSTKKCIVDEGLTGQISDSMVKPELGQYCNSQSLELKVTEPTVASTEERTENERLTGRKNCSRPSLELEVNEASVASTEERAKDERLMGQKSERFIKAGQRQNCSSSLETQVKVPNVASPEDCIADEGLTGQKSDIKVKSVTEIQRPAEQERNDKTEKNRLAKHQRNKPPPNKSAFLKHKLGRARTGSDDSVLFAPDIVVKKFAKKRPSGGSQDCSKVKKLKEHRQERQDCPDRTSPHHRENLQKVTEKVPGPDTPHQKSKRKLELCGILSVNKTKTAEPKKVRFDLFGSNREKQINVPGRHFSATVTLTVSDNCREYTDGLSAKQKVHNQWSSTFIPKMKTQIFSPRSPQKKNKQKTHDSINMTALKSHLTHRASLLSSGERETNHFRKPGFHPKLT